MSGTATSTVILLFEDELVVCAMALEQLAAVVKIEESPEKRAAEHRAVQNVIDTAHQALFHLMPSRRPEGNVYVAIGRPLEALKPDA